ncbi:MAG: helix-turn-helix domain-containing protein [Spirochaetota bacterium]
MALQDKSSARRPWRIVFILCSRSPVTTAYHVRSTLRFVFGAQEICDASLCSFDLIPITLADDAAIRTELQSLKRMQFDGAIVFADDGYRRFFPNLVRAVGDKPCVRVYHPSFFPDGNTVMNDYSSIMADIFSLVKKRRHPALGFIGVMPGEHVPLWFRLYREGMAQHGMPINPSHIYGVSRENGVPVVPKPYRDLFNENSAALDHDRAKRLCTSYYRETAHAFCSSYPMPDAVIVSNPNLAHFISASTKTHGTIAPEIISMSRYIFEAFPTEHMAHVADDHEEMGQLAAAALIDILAGKRPRTGQRILLKAGIISYRSGADNGQNDPFPSMVREFVLRHYRLPNIAERLASALALNRDYLRKKVLRVSGLVLNDMIHAERVKHAKNMLSFTSMPIIDIAYAVGYDSLRTFNRIFRHVAGAAPRDFRAERRI